MSLTALLCLAAWVSPQKPAWNPPSRTTLSIPLEQPDGQGEPLTNVYLRAENSDGQNVPFPRGGSRALVLGLDDLGWPTRYELPPEREPQQRGGKRWTAFRVPRHAKVAIAFLHENYELVEEVIPVGSEDREIVLHLKRAQDMASLSLEPQEKSFLGGPMVRVRSPRFGLAVEHALRVSGGAGPQTLPVGEYEIEWPRRFGLCGNPPTLPEYGLPRRRVVRLDPGVNLLRFEDLPASHLSLEVRSAAGEPSPELDFGKEAMDPLLWDANPPPGFLRAKLVRGEDQIYLGWTWNGLGRWGFASVLPVDQRVSQGIAVPPGSYTLVLAGQGISEMHVPLELKPGWNLVQVQLESF